MTVLLLALSALSAEYDPNREPSISVGVAWRPTRDDHRWGVELGGTWRFALGDHCSWSETDCAHQRIWPIVGPTAAVSWRGGAHLGYDLGVVAGAADVDMHQFGFFPMWELLVGAGWSGDTDGPDALGLSAELGRSTSFNRGSRTYGFDPMALRVGAVARLSPKGWVDPALRARLELSPIGFDYL